MTGQRGQPPSGRWSWPRWPRVLGVSVLDLLRPGQRPRLAIAARLGHFRDPGAADRALKRAATLTGSRTRAAEAIFLVRRRRGVHLRGRTRWSWRRSTARGRDPERFRR